MIAVGTTVADVQGRTYRITRELGEGGQGIIFGAAETTTGTLCIVKCYHPAIATKEAEQRLDVLVGLNLSARSPALCAPAARLAPQHGLGAVQPKAQGESLEEIFKNPAYSLMDAVVIAVVLCRALAVAEKLGVAHGDLAASNVHVSHNGCHPEVHVIDFDNASLPGAPPPTFRGQDFYCAPELLTGFGTPTIESDRFSLGVLLYELFLLRHPYAVAFTKGGGFQAYVQTLSQGWLEDPMDGQVMSTPEGRPVAILSRPLQGLFRRAFHTDPQNRPGACEWAQALEAALTDLYTCDRCSKEFCNDTTRLVCPYCGVGASGFNLHINGRVVSLSGMRTTAGRDEVGGDGTVSRTHAVFRRHGFGLVVRNTSQNGFWVRGGAGTWVEVLYGQEIAVCAGMWVRFAPRLEGIIAEQRA